MNITCIPLLSKRTLIIHHSFYLQKPINTIRTIAHTRQSKLEMWQEKNLKEKTYLSILRFCILVECQVMVVSDYVEKYFYSDFCSPLITVSYYFRHCQDKCEKIKIVTLIYRFFKHLFLFFINSQYSFDVLIYTLCIGLLSVLFMLCFPSNFIYFFIFAFLPVCQSRL